MKNLKTNIHEYNLVKKDIVFVDGVTRVGKTMLSRVIGSLSRVSHPQVIELLEQILVMYNTGHMDKNATSSLLRLHLNERFYSYSLSRNLNFRYDDLTSIHNSTCHEDFFKNLSKKDGDDAMIDLQADDVIHHFWTHDILTHYSSFLDLDIPVRIIEVFRNPIDTIHSWYKRGWGKRFDNKDPRNFTVLFDYNKSKTLPHHAIGNEDIYLSLNEMEKCLFMHNLLIQKSLDEYRKLTHIQKNNILIIKYEDMLEQHDIEINHICSFLNVKRTNFTNRALEDASIPRIINKESRMSKLNDIKGKVSQNLFNELMHTVNTYEENTYGLKE